VSLWRSLDGKDHITTLNMKLYRMVENQEEIATTLITSNPAEQSILEELLEQSKPIQSNELSQRHYLIKTPFRYPPLRHGSRFGAPWEPSLFYGATKKQTVLAEVAYYRFRFLADMENAEALTRHNIQSNHSVFYISAHSNKAIQLTHSPFVEYRDEISATDSFTVSQKLGKSMREDGIELFSFYSARLADAVNGAAFVHSAIKSSQPKDIEHWQCLTQLQRVVFHNAETKTIEEFSLEQFCKNGRLPIDH
jgi:hypothetical protein